MDDLRLLGVDDDGVHLVLADPVGRRWRLVIDERLGAAVRRDRSRLGQLEIETGHELRPKEIQARLRAGEAAEDIARIGAMPLERVERYEGPVLAERAHMARQAGAILVRRGDTEGPLGSLVNDRLEAHGVDPDNIVWDSWRREDGTWQISVSYPGGDRTRAAEWVYDTVRRSVTPCDDEAHWLVDGVRPERAATGPGATVRSLRPVSVTLPEPQPDNDPQPEDASAVGEEVKDDVDVELEEGAELPADPTLASAAKKAAGAAAELNRAGEQANKLDAAPSDVDTRRQRLRLERRPREGSPTRRAVPSWDEILFGPTRE